MSFDTNDSRKPTATTSFSSTFHAPTKSSILPVDLQPQQQSFSDSGIASVAVKIQDRAMQLMREQQQLQGTQDEFDYQRQLLEEEQARTNKIHQGYLKSYRSAYGIELEYLKLQGEMKDCQRDTAKLNEETEQLDDQLEAEHASWQTNVVENLLAKHKTKQELYKKSLQAAISVRENANAERERKLELLRQEAHRFETERDWVIQQQQQVDSYVDRMSFKEEEQNLKVEELAEQVRSSLQKVRVVFTFEKRCVPSHSTLPNILFLLSLANCTSKRTT